jgi:beta-N-acetylhexosaminidase
MTFALDRLKKEGVIADNVTADCNCYNGHSATEYEENVKNSDVVFIALEMYSAGNLDSTNSRGWQAAFTDDMIELAHKYGKKVVYISANIPYDVARFQKADAVLAAYSANGMDKLPVDGEETPAYGENYPAAIITALGGNSPTGKLPVDIYALDENSQYTDEILYPFGYGLSFKSDEPAPETTASSTTTTTASTTSASTQPESTAKSESTTKSTTTTSKAATTAAATNSGTSSPKTGSAAPSVAMIALALSASVAVSSRKKK